MVSAGIAKKTKPVLGGDSKPRLTVQSVLDPLQSGFKDKRTEPSFKTMQPKDD